MKRFVILCGVLALSACELSLPAMPSGGNAPRDVVLQEDIRVRAPKGFCVDETSLKDSQSGSFVLIGHCAGLKGRKAPELKDKAALLTLSLSPSLAQPDRFDAPSLVAIFASEPGRAALSRSGAASSVTLLDSAADGDRVFVHARDTSPARLQGLSDEYWRALFLLKGRLATVTVTPYASSEMNDAALKSRLESFISDLIRQNPDLAEEIVAN